MDEINKQVRRDKEYIRRIIQEGKDLPKREENLKWKASESRFTQKIELPEPKEFHNETVNYLAQ